MTRLALAHGPAATEPFSPGLRRSIGVVMIGASLSFLDSTIVNVALHSLSVSRAFAAASVTIFSLGAAMFGGMILMPLYFQVVRGQDVIATALLLASAGAGALLANRLAAPMTDRLGSGATALAGGLVSVAATAAAAADAFGTTFAWVLAVTAVATAPALLLIRAERRTRPVPPATSSPAKENPDAVH